ncbi:protein kinase-like protein [Azomonas agilis]|uniref:Protein kinase-like protein n=1 Tax=Azomonas agilis TaxID=116849 RepID=A0A562I2H7_9GAMM|nr:AarF/UbiB family protein [Azomonas agilis]TWH64898.1 protein kinase-like protein [Azomonas agilis]
MSLAKVKRQFEHGSDKKNKNEPTEDTVTILQSAQPFLKAEVRIERKQNKTIIIKDYSHYAGTIWAPVARYLMRREAKVLQKLKGWAHVPDFLSFNGQYAFSMEYVEGRRVNRVEPSYPAHFVTLLRVVGELHRKGVFHNDLRSTNILISDQGRLVLIDYGASLIVPNWKICSPVRRALRALNLARIVKLKKQISTQPLTQVQSRLLLVRRWFIRVRTPIGYVRRFIKRIQIACTKTKGPESADIDKSVKQSSAYKLYFWHDRNGKERNSYAQESQKALLKRHSA